MKKVYRHRNLVIALLFVMAIVIPSLVVLKPTYAISGDTVSFTLDRKTLQDYVVSTAKQYLYKNTYTDYEQHSMDDTSTSVSKATFMFRTFASAPVDLSRSNFVNLDCSSFVSSVYINALGYSFIDYYNLTSGYNYYFNTSHEFVKQKENKSAFRYGTMYTGKGNSTFMLEKIAQNVASSPSAGVIYKGNATSSLVPFYYKLTGSEDSSKVSEVYNEFKSTLQNGDVFVIRYDKNGSAAGHVMLYSNDVDVDGTLSEGFIHSTGVDFNFTNPVNGDDAYSTRFMTYDEFRTSYDTDLGYLFATRSNGKVPTAVMILRPINEVLAKNYTNFYDNTSGSVITSRNTIALNEMKNLSFEQYMEKVEGDKVRNLSKYNSVNYGDVVNYNLEVVNKSKSISSTISVSDTLPSGVSFVSCTLDCVYDEGARTVTWNNSTLNVTDSLIYSYKVKVNDSGISNVVSNGYKVTSSSSNVLRMPSLNLMINPTYRGSERELLLSTIESMKSKISDGSLVLDSSAGFSNYKVKLDTLSSDNSVSITRNSVLKTLYYNALDVDLLTLSGYKTAVFETVSGSGYTRKTTGEVDVNKLNPSLIPGLYGGRKVRGNVEKNRTTLINLDDLEIGDLVISGSVSDVYLYLGVNPNTSLHEFVDNDFNVYSGTSAKTLLRSAFTYDTFVILRPSRVNATLANFSYNGGESSEKVDSKMYAIGSTYGSLPSASKSYTVSFDTGVDADEVSSLSAKNDLEGWYLDSDLTNKITKESVVSDAKFRTMYAKYNNDSITLPTPTKSGSIFSGWYNNDGTTKIGDGGDSYTPTSDVTLYAKWEELSGDPTLTSSVLDVDGTKKTIKYSIEESSVETISSSLSINSEFTLKYYNSSDVEITSGKLGTGSMVKVYFGDTLVYTYKTVLVGDVNGDANLKLDDIMSISNYVYVNKDLLKDVFLLAGDYNGDGSYNLSDIMQLANKVYVVGFITDITITSYPSKTTYYVGDTFNPTGLVVKSVSSFGDRSEVTDYKIDPINFNAPGNYDIVVRYKSFIEKFSVTVKTKPNIPYTSSGAIGKEYSKETSSVSDPRDSVLIKTKRYKYTYRDFMALSNDEKEVIYNDVTGKFIFTAPHSAPQLREGAIKVREPGTEAVCNSAATSSGGVCISRLSYDGTDPNYYLYTKFTEIANTFAGRMKAVAHVDFHGMADDEEFRFAIGTRKGDELQSEYKCIEANLAKALYERYGARVSVNTSGSCNFSGSYMVVSDGRLQGGKVIQELDSAYNNIQLEMVPDFRSSETSSTTAGVVVDFLKDTFGGEK